MTLRIGIPIMAGRTLEHRRLNYQHVLNLLKINITWFENLPLLGTKKGRPALRAGLPFLKDFPFSISIS
jgi:hypothetical protein